MYVKIRLKPLVLQVTAWLLNASFEVIPLNETVSAFRVQRQSSRHRETAYIINV